MKIGVFSVLAFATVGLLVLISCASNAAGTPPVSITKPAEGPRTGTLQNDWDRVVMDARKEGEVCIYWSEAPEVQRLLSEKFREKYGIIVSLYSARGPESAERMSREYAAGITNADITMIGYMTVLTYLKPKGIIVPLDDIIVLPEVLGPSNWISGKFPWVFDEHSQIKFGATVNSGIWRNTDLVKDNEIKEYHDLLKPEYKGKIVFFDPTVVGGASAWFRLYYPVLGEDFMKGVIKQDPAVIRDGRLVVEWLARGKYPILLAGASDTLVQFKNAGAPIAFVETREGEYLSSGGGSLAVANRAPHPNAAKLFSNWILTKEGQTLWSRGSLYPSFRADVPSDHLDPTVVPKPGKVYLFETPETAARMEEYLELSKKLFAGIVPK